MFGLIRVSALAFGLTFAGHPLLAENPVPESSPRESVESRSAVMRRYMQASNKVNAIPEIASLKEKADEARRSYQEAFEVAMGKEDSELLKQYQSLRESRFQMAGDPNRGGIKAQSKAVNPYNRLSDEEKKRLDTARREAMQSPAVKEARLKRNQAKNEEERIKAVAAYREVLHQAMIEVDEEVKDLLEKLEGK